MRREFCVIPAASLNDIFRATLVARIQYAVSMRSGMCSAADRARFESVYCVAANVLATAARTSRLSRRVDGSFNVADDDFSSASIPTATMYHSHILTGLDANLPHQQRARSQHMTHINKTTLLNNSDFIVRMLYKYS